MLPKKLISAFGYLFFVVFLAAFTMGAKTVQVLPNRK